MNILGKWTPKQSAKDIADRYAVGSSRDELEYEIHRAINLCISNITGKPPGPSDPPGPVPARWG